MSKFDPVAIAAKQMKKSSDQSAAAEKRRSALHAEQEALRAKLRVQRSEAAKAAIAARSASVYSQLDCVKLLGLLTHKLLSEPGANHLHLVFAEAAVNAAASPEAAALSKAAGTTEFDPTVLNTLFGLSLPMSREVEPHARSDDSAIQSPVGMQLNHLGGQELQAVQPKLADDEDPQDDLQ